MQALLLVVLCSAVLLSMEEATRHAFLEAVDGRAKPALALPRASRRRPDPAKLYMTSAGSIWCGRHLPSSDS